MDVEPIRDAKRLLRRTTIGLIRAMDPERRRIELDALHARFKQLPGIDRAEVVFGYRSHLPEEIETPPMLRWLLELGKTLVLPRVDRLGSRLRLHAVEDLDRDLEPGPFGIPEPSDRAPVIEPDRVDWALIPGVAFDDGGRRLGRGAGYYDRLLPLLKPEAPRWALIFESQWVDRVPVEDHDARIGGIASASKVWNERQS